MNAFVKCGLILWIATAASGNSITTTDVVFHLFSRNNPTTSEGLLASLESIMRSSFSLSRRTVFTIHDFDETVSGNFNAFLVPAEIAAEDVNVIAVDWSSGASFYTVGLTNAPDAGAIVASFANILITSFGYSPGMIKVVGVGLGGHIAGIAARQMLGTIPHIVALDPSFHGWTHHPDRLSESDAEFVEVLHTTSGIRGYDYPLGHLDFYPNGGTYQNGCGTDTSCSHIYSYAFYAESINADITNAARFVATACDSYDDAVRMACTGARDVVFGGVAAKTGLSGIYSFSTNFAQPFAQG